MENEVKIYSQVLLLLLLLTIAISVKIKIINLKANTSCTRQFEGSRPRTMGDIK